MLKGSVNSGEDLNEIVEGEVSDCYIVGREL